MPSTTDELSLTFGALADPTRRAILTRLASGEATVTELAEPFDMSLPAVSQHLKVLERARLISRGREAQRRPCRLEAKPLQTVADWLEQYRRFFEERMDRLESYVRELHTRKGTMTVATGSRKPRPSPEKLELEITRVFDAPRERVWDAYTRPEHIVDWWGPRRYTTTVIEMDVRPGGRWRFVQRAPDGTEHPFTGVYKEVVKPERLVNTFIYDVEGIREHEMLDIAIFEDLGGKTKLTAKSVFPSREAMEGALVSGMEAGWVESLDRLEDLVTRR